jgi:starvation-inducible DNA-binding protein
MNDPVIDGLQNLLADSYILYIKLQNFHWNVTGPSFGPLHKLFEEQYIELREAIDLIAERIRALGGFAIGSCAEFTQTSSLQEAQGRGASWNNMVQELLSDHQAIAKECKKFLEGLDDADDEGTSHIVADRINVHEKAAWMLKSHLDR